MTSLILTKTRMQQGVWEGLFTGASHDAAPKLDVVHQGKQVPDVTVKALEDKSGFAVHVRSLRMRFRTVCRRLLYPMQYRTNNLRRSH